jgi:hypothetical protein
MSVSLFVKAVQNFFFCGICPKNAGGKSSAETILGVFLKKLFIRGHKKISRQKQEGNGSRCKCQDFFFWIVLKINFFRMPQYSAKHEKASLFISPLFGREEQQQQSLFSLFSYFS